MYYRPLNFLHIHVNLSIYYLVFKEYVYTRFRNLAYYREQDIRLT